MAMRNGFLGALLLLSLPLSLAQAQTPPAPEATAVLPGGDPFWQPPRTDTDDRPNLGPGGYRFYGSVDYLLWWTAKDRPVTSLTSNPSLQAANVLLPQATDFGPLLRNGINGDLGIWLNQQQTVGIELGGLWLDNRAPRDQGQTADVGLRAQLHDHFAGADAQLRAEIYRGTWAHVDFLGGFQYLSLDEALSIAGHSNTTGIITSDRFSTRNDFYGGILGAEMEIH